MSILVPTGCAPRRLSHLPDGDLPGRVSISQSCTLHSDEGGND